jgi:hypothetical protein
VITQDLDRAGEGRLVCMDDDALVQLLQIEHRLTRLREGLGQLGAGVDLGASVVGVVARAAAGAAHAAAASSYLTDVFGDLVRRGTERECRRFLRLMRDFLFALEHAEDLAIDRRVGVRGHPGEEEWSIRGGRELIARVRGGSVEWLRFYCRVHKEWLPEGGCEHSRAAGIAPGVAEDGETVGRGG